MATKKKPKMKKASSKPKEKTRKYEGASKKKRLSRWVAPSTSAITSISGGLVTLRDRARDLRRNNPYASRAIQVLTSNVIGPGIVTQFRFDGAPAVEIENKWNEWAESKAIDFDGRHNIYGLQRLIFDAVAESGEVLLRKRFNAALSFPLQYQVLESDFLDTTRTEPGVAGNYVVQGVEFDPQGRRVAYFLFENHPGGYDSANFSFSQKSNRIPASEVRHIFRQDRPGQARGVTWLAPVIIRIKDLDDYEDAQLMRQKIAACFTAFVRDISGDFAEEDEDCDEEELGDRLEPGIIEHLPTGKTIEFTKPPEVQGFKDYKVTVLQGIAAGLGITYEALAADYSNVNFSSARMGWLEFGRNIKTWRETIVFAHCLDPIASDFLEISSIQGLRTDGVTYAHVAPIREMIDPRSEVSSMVDSIRAGLSTLTDELLAMGKNPIDHFNQYKKDKELLKEYGLILDSDPSKVMKAGITQQYVADDEGDTKEEEKGAGDGQEDQASGESTSGGI